jgi:hypothetical protein
MSAKFTRVESARFPRRGGFVHVSPQTADGQFLDVGRFSLSETWPRATGIERDLTLTLQKWLEELDVGGGPVLAGLWG